MTEELRWILLVAGVVLIAGVYLWGLRSRRRSAAPEHERATRHESPPATRGAAPAAPRLEPGLEPAEGSSERGDFASASAHESLPVIEVDREDAVLVRATQSARREPRIGDTAAVPTPDAASPPRSRASAAGVAPSTATRPPAAPQKIFALRVTAPASTPFGGRALREAIMAEGLEYGRYKVFHRLHTDGEPVFSLASLKEPGTFDPATMDGASFRGVAMFAVLPGPVAPGQAFDALIEAARAIADRVGGVLQDDRGAVLSVARLEQLRAEVAAYERSRPTAAGR
jgi:cell division protein ZipA